MAAAVPVQPVDHVILAVGGKRESMPGKLSPVPQCFDLGGFEGAHLLMNEVNPLVERLGPNAMLAQDAVERGSVYQVENDVLVDAAPCHRLVTEPRRYRGAAAPAALSWLARSGPAKAPVFARMGVDGSSVIRTC